MGNVIFALTNEEFMGFRMNRALKKEIKQPPKNMPIILEPKDPGKIANTTNKRKRKENDKSQHFQAGWPSNQN